MKKTCKAIFSLVLALVLVMSLTVTAFAQPTAAADIVYRGKDRLLITPKAGGHTSTDLFGNFKGVMPGDTLTETVTIRNESTTANTNYVKLYIDTDAMNAFLSNFTMTVAQGTKQIFSGKPNAVGSFGGTGCLLGTFRKGQSTTLTVTLSLDIQADNTVANGEGEVDWKFIAEEYTGSTKPPMVTPGKLIQTGQLNWPVWLLSGLGIVLVILGGTMTLRKKKENA